MSLLIAVYISKQYLAFSLIYVFTVASNFQAVAVSKPSSPQLLCLLNTPIKMAPITDSSTKNWNIFYLNDSTNAWRDNVF
jgi:hypothetical protein